MASPKGQTVDLTSLTTSQLSQVKKQLDDELEHLSTSFTQLRNAQTKFRDCVKSIDGGIANRTTDTPLLVPLTTSLYVPGTLADPDHVIVDVGTGFYIEKKTTTDAKKFYTGKVEELGTNLKDLESIIQGKASNLRVVEDVLRQKVISNNTANAST